MRTSSSIVVAGYGNPLRRDDGVGWRVAEVVAARWAGRVTVRMGQQLVPEWAADLASAEIAFIVDASVTWRGRLRLRRLVPAPDEPLLDGHSVRPEDLLRLVHLVYGRQPQTFLLELPAVDVGFGDVLSRTAADGFRRAVRLLDRRLSGLVERDVDTVQR